MLSADLGSGGETLTYTSVAAGVDGRIQTRRVTAQISYRYERDIDMERRRRRPGRPFAASPWSTLEVVPGALQLDAGALATRTGGRGPRRSASPTATRRSTSIAPMSARRFRPMPARWRSTPPTGSAMSRSTTTASPARSTRISTARSRTAPPPASAWRRAAAAVRLDRRRRLCPRGLGRPLRPAFRGLLCPRRRRRAGRPDARPDRRRRL